jgi:hypothetical protein
MVAPTSKTLSSKLFAIIEHLKRAETPQSIEAIRQATRLDLMRDMPLWESIRSNPKIQIEASGKLTYKAAYTIKSKSDLLTLIKEHWEAGKSITMGVSDGRTRRIAY